MRADPAYGARCRERDRVYGRRVRAAAYEFLFGGIP